MQRLHAEKGIRPMFWPAGDLLHDLTLSGPKRHYLILCVFSIVLKRRPIVAARISRPRRGTLRQCQRGIRWDRDWINISIICVGKICHINHLYSSSSSRRICSPALAMPPLTSIQQEARSLYLARQSQGRYAVEALLPGPQHREARPSRVRGIAERRTTIAPRHGARPSASQHTIGRGSQSRDEKHVRAASRALEPPEKSSFSTASTLSASAAAHDE